MLKYEKAIVFATNAHHGQKRKGNGHPYIIHPLTVGMLLLDQGCAEEIVIAGILHDTVEDTSITLNDIEANFGPKVKRIVRGVSEPDKELPWRIRKEHTIEHIKIAPLAERLVLCADKLHNISSMFAEYQLKGESLWEVFNGSKEEQLWYYQSLLASLKERRDIPANITLLADLEKRIKAFVNLVK